MSFKLLCKYLIPCRCGKLEVRIKEHHKGINSNVVNGRVYLYALDFGFLFRKKIYKGNLLNFM